MKKIILTIPLIATCLYGCNPSVEDMDSRNDRNNSQFEVKQELAKFVFLVEDRETGCQYIQSQSSDFYYQYSPYYDGNGKVLGCNNE